MTMLTLLQQQHHQLGRTVSLVRRTLHKPQHQSLSSAASIASASSAVQAAGSSPTIVTNKLQHPLQPSHHLFIACDALRLFGSLPPTTTSSFISHHHQSRRSFWSSELRTGTSKPPPASSDPSAKNASIAPAAAAAGGSSSIDNPPVEDLVSNGKNGNEHQQQQQPGGNSKEPGVIAKISSTASSAAKSDVATSGVTAAGSTTTPSLASQVGVGSEAAAGAASVAGAKPPVPTAAGGTPPPGASDADSNKSADINTAKGRLVLTTSNEGTDLKIVIEKPGADGKTRVDGKTVRIDAPPPAPAVTDKEIRRRARVDFNRSSLERNFITPTRAMSDFLLKPSDLEPLTKTKRRSPYESEPPITVYWRKDVEAKAIEVWGTRENLQLECLKREIEKKMHQQNIFTVKRRLRDYRREVGSRTNAAHENQGLKGRSGRVVLTAIAINAANFIFKLSAWLLTQSHTMFAEMIHSAADTINQIILAYGIHKSTQIADIDHPYGYSNMKYVTSLISGVAIFCGGAGISLYHGYSGLATVTPVGDYYWAFWILGGSLISEGATLVMALSSIRHSAAKANMSFVEYVRRGEDPCVNVVLFEDSAALLSVVVAGSMIGLSTWLQSSVPDAVGSLLVGGILAVVASYIIHSNSNALVGRSIPMEQLDKINQELESDVMIRAIHDVKGIDMGSSLVRYKAEMDFDGRELSRFYLEKLDLQKLLADIQQIQTVDELEEHILKHGESIVDLMGGEIDRIEMKLRKKFPEIRHCDLEIL